MHVSRNLACHIRHETCDNQLQNYFCSHKFFIRMELPVFMNDLHVHEEYAAKNPDVFLSWNDHCLGLLCSSWTYSLFSITELAQADNRIWRNT